MPRKIMQRDNVGGADKEKKFGKMYRTVALNIRYKKKPLQSAYCGEVFFHFFSISL